MEAGLAVAEETLAVPAVKPKTRKTPLSLGRLASYIQSIPLWLILGFFLLLPILMITVVSFWDYDFAQMYPDFVTFNYGETLGGYRVDVTREQLEGAPRYDHRNDDDFWTADNGRRIYDYYGIAPYWI